MRGLHLVNVLDVSFSVRPYSYCTASYYTCRYNKIVLVLLELSPDPGQHGAVNRVVCQQKACMCHYNVSCVQLHAGRLIWDLDKTTVCNSAISESWVAHAGPRTDRSGSPRAAGFHETRQRSLVFDHRAQRIRPCLLTHF